MCHRPDLALRQRDGRRRHALPGPWLEHQIAEVEWGAAEINATFGNYGGAASMPADVDSLAGIAAPRVTQSPREITRSTISPL